MFTGSAWFLSGLVMDTTVLSHNAYTKAHSCEALDTLFAGDETKVFYLTNIKHFTIKINKTKY